jgi:hypothetical protein
MSTTYTTNVNLGKPATADRNWDVPLSANCDVLEAQSPLAGGNVTPSEDPSASLNVRVAGFTYMTAAGTLGTFAAVASTTLTASATSYLFLNASYALTVNTTGFPTTPHIRLAVAVTGLTTISSISDARVYLEPVLAPSLLLAGGAMADGATIAAGSSTGLQIATATTQKLGFFGKAPAVQPALGVATASGTWTATEQGMLNALWTAARALGLGS